MHTSSYQSALNHASELAPTLDKPGEFIRWAEDICQLLSYIYGQSYETVTEDLYDNVKEAQNYEDTEE